MSDFREELAWAAGFWDGEGHYGVNNRNQLVGRIVQASKSPLIRFQRVVGGKLYGPYTRAQSNRKPVWSLQFNGFEKVQALGAMLWIFSSRPKRQQFMTAINKWKVSH